jgi:hypothetical protein
LHHDVQFPVFQALADLFARQVDAVQEEHHENADIDDDLGVHGAALGTKLREEIRQHGGQHHAAQEPVGHQALEVFENEHKGTCRIESGTLKTKPNASAPWSSASCLVKSYTSACSFLRSA